MACGGHCNVCPSHPGYDPPVSVVSWPDDPLDSLEEVKGYYHFYYAAWYIDYELNRRSDTPPAGWFDPIGDAVRDSDDIVTSDDYTLLRTGLDDAANGWSSTWFTDQYISAGAPIRYESMNEMRDKIDTLRAECLCNCNYACTCNCNYCTCNCNYACTCDCNYSDRRLKTDIKYL